MHKSFIVTVVKKSGNTTSNVNNTTNKPSINKPYTLMIKVFTLLGLTALDTVLKFNIIYYKNNNKKTRLEIFQDEFLFLI